MSGVNDFNKYGEYRRIRYERTYRPLGRMSLWRIILGLALLVFVLFLSGTVSSSLAARGRFRAAQRLMVSPRWMEQYRPEVKAFIDAGVRYEDGDFAGALAGFDALEGDAAAAMRSAAAVKLAAALEGSGDHDGAFDALMKADPSLLSEAERGEFRTLCETLRAHYASLSDSAAAERAARLSSLPGAQ